MQNRALWSSVLFLLASSSLWAAVTAIFDMDTVRHRPSEVTDKNKQKVPIGTLEAVEGKFGKAVQFSFSGGVGAGFMTAAVTATPEWDQAQGFSVYVKGDGSTNWGGLELIDKSDYSLRYGFCFPIDSTEWKKILVSWSDLIPELAGPLVNAQHGYAPSRVGNFWFGKWHYWRDYPAHSYAIDQIVLEKAIALGSDESNPQTGLKRVAAKLKNKQPITIVTMGDSLSDKRHWANRQILWSEQLVRDLTSIYGCEVTLVNPALGGTALNQNLILMPKWLRQAPTPDLVTVWFGFNDWDNKVRGPRFKEYMLLAVDRIRRLTRGSADVLLMTTCPAHGRWDTMQEMEKAVREVAQEKVTGLVDIAAEFHKVESPDKALQQQYWAWDKTHLGTNGHAVVAKTVLKAIKQAE